jgi:hypothetical protein
MKNMLFVMIGEFACCYIKPTFVLIISNFTKSIRKMQDVDDKFASKPQGVGPSGGGLGLKVCFL